MRSSKCKLTLKGFLRNECFIIKLCQVNAKVGQSEMIGRFNPFIGHYRQVFKGVVLSFILAG